MSRVLPLLTPGALKIIDTHDVFSTKQRKVVQFGVCDGLSLSAGEERERLERADLVLAIQPLEEEELAGIVPSTPVITVGVDFETVANGPSPSGRQVLYVASDNAMNVKGLRDFLNLAWPWISRDVPDAEFLVAGRVSQAVTTTDQRVKLLGPVPDLDRLYRQAKVAINPSVAGTGLKVKTVEALSRFRPLVTWPTGVDGIDPELAALCHTAQDWYGFYQRVVEVLKDPKPDWFDPRQRKLIADHLEPETVYGELRQRLEKFFKTSKARAR